MSCDHQLLATHVGALLDGTLPDSLRVRCEQALHDCEHCRASHAQALAYAAMASDWQQEPVPKWNRARHLVKPRVQQTPPWLSWGALAASVLAVVLVSTQAEISTADGLVIRFGGELQETRVQQLIATALAANTASQAAVLDARLADFATRQLDASRLQFADWADSNRLERRQELNLLLSGWQNQRLQDQQVYAARFNELTNEQIESNQYLNTLMQTVVRPGRSGL